MKKVALYVLAILAGLYVVYVLAINVFLASKTGQGYMNAAPELVEMHFGKVRSFIPGKVYAEDISIRVQDGQIQMWIRGDSASMTINPLTLITSQTFTGTHLRAEGVSIRVRERTAKAPTTLEMIRLPPIDGFDTPKLDGPRPPPPTDDNLVSVDLRDMEVKDLRELWIDEYRVTGSISAHGGFYYKPLRRMRLDQVGISAQNAKLHFGAEQVVANDINAEILANVPELDFVGFRQKALAVMDAAVKLDANVTSSGFVNYYLKDIPDVRIAEGKGALSMLLDVKNGQIIPGSRLALDTTRVVIDLPDFFAAGKGSIRWAVREGKAWLDVKVKDMELVEESTREIRMRGPELTLAAVTTGLDLSKTMNLVLVLDVPTVKGDDLSFLSTYIPEGTGVKIGGGKGTASGSLEIDALKQEARGTLSIDGERIVVKTRGATMRGKIKVRGVVGPINLKTGTTDFHGSTLALEDVSVDADGGKWTGFWAKVEAKTCKLKAAKDLRWSCRLGLDFQSLFPIMNVVAANVPIPWVLKAFSDLRDVHVDAMVRAHPHLVELDHLAVKTGILALDADMRLKESGDTFLPYGSLLVKIGAIPVGVDLEGKRASPVLLNAERRFLEHRIKWEENGGK